MDRRNILMAGWLAMSRPIGSGTINGQERPKALKELVTRLNVSDRGVGAWLEELGVNSTEPVSNGYSCQRSRRTNRRAKRQKVLGRPG